MPNRAAPPARVPKTTVMTVNMTHALLEALRERAAALGVSVSAFIRSAVERELKRAGVKVEGGVK